MNETFDISKFDEYREDNRREVKRASEGLPDSLWDTYSAFANCYGGVIILGVSEKSDGSWKATGLQDANKLRKTFWDTINNRKKVSINLLSDDDIEMYTVGEKQDVIMVIYVPMAKRWQKPVYINNDMFGKTFRRNGEGDYHCTEIQIKAMLRDQTENTIDMEVLDNVPMEDLNYDTVHGYRNRHKALKPGHTFEHLDDYEYLRRIGAAAISVKDKQLHPTAAGLLMFGDDYNIVRQFPNYFLDYREELDPAIRWTDRLHSSSGDWSGNVCDFYFRVYNKIIKDIKVPFKMQGGVRIDDTPVHKALREALANCLINADYLAEQGVVIKKEQDQYIFDNPGYIRTGKAQMRLGGESDPRNKALMKMFNLINIGERAGSGVPGIFDVWKENGWVEPIIEERFKPDRTILTLKTISMRQQQVKILQEYISKANNFSNEELAIMAKVSRDPDFLIYVPDEEGVYTNKDSKIFVETMSNNLFHYIERKKRILTFVSELAEKMAESAEKSAESAEKSAESAENLSAKQIEILRLMEKNVEYSATEVADGIGLKGPRTRQLLNELVDMGILETTAVTKNRRYVKK